MCGSTGLICVWSLAAAEGRSKMAVQTVMVKQPIAYPYVERKERVCGGRPVIVNTRITVSLVAELANSGHSADEIVAMYPHLNHSEIYDALSYYYDHREEIDREIQENTEEYWKERVKGFQWQI